jgi:hypothetical protein
MSITSTFAADLIFLFEGAGLGLAYTGLNRNIFKGSKAVIPSIGAGPWVSIILTGGDGDEGTHNLSPLTIAYERPSAQIVCRAEAYEDAEALAHSLYMLLNFVNTFVNGTWWRICTPKQEPFDLGTDSVGKPRVAFNIDCVKRLSPATS